MTRSMKDANTALFTRLVNHCAARGTLISRPSAARWVASDPVSRDLLKNLKVLGSISFGRFRHCAWLQYDNTHYLCTVGFEQDDNVLKLSPVENVQGYDVCLLSELPVQPRSGPAGIRNVVEYGSKEDSDYEGHDGDAVIALFPEIRVFKNGRDILDEAVVWPACLLVCVAESALMGSWIEEPLASSLGALADLAVPSLPYRELCRAVLDLDPRSLYMALYRCIEATYAFEHASRLAAALSLSMSWHEVAASLDAHMGWHPPEANSLNVALTHAQGEDLRSVCDCLGQTVGADLHASAGKAIYKLRNQIVHYRPTAEPLILESVDWNTVCNLLVTIALDVFHQAYQ
jgi:hypothetical protein